MVQPPFPSIMAMADIMENTGDTTETAATCALSPNLAIKTYLRYCKKIMSIMITADGIAIDAMAFQTDPFHHFFILHLDPPFLS